MTPLFSQTGWEGELEREKERERKEGIFRERGSNFSLEFPAIGQSDPGEPRDKVALRCTGYAWAPVLWSSTTPGGRGFLLLDLILV